MNICSLEMEENLPALLINAHMYLKMFLTI